jgi:hypothetical protein
MRDEGNIEKNVQMGPFFMAKRRMGYSRNVISHASSLLVDVVSCTVSGISPRNTEAESYFNLTYLNKKFLQRQDIEEISHFRYVLCDKIFEYED